MVNAYQQQTLPLSQLMNVLVELKIQVPPQTSYEQLLDLLQSPTNDQIPFFRAALKPFNVWQQVAPIVDLSTKNKFGHNILHFAALWGKDEIIQDLLKRGFNPNERDSAYNTPLHHAASLARNTTIEILRQAKADPTLTNLSGKTPKDLAREKLESTGAISRERFEQTIQLL